MMGHKERLVGGREWDAFTRWRKYLLSFSRTHVAKKIKQSYNRRIRRKVRRECKNEDYARLMGSDGGNTYRVSLVGYCNRVASNPSCAY